MAQEPTRNAFMKLLSDGLNKMSAKIWLELPERNALVGLHLADRDDLHCLCYDHTDERAHTHITQHTGQSVRCGTGRVKGYVYGHECLFSWKVFRDQLTPRLL